VPRRCSSSVPKLGSVTLNPASICSSCRHVLRCCHLIYDPFVPRTQYFSCWAIGVVIPVLNGHEKILLGPCILQYDSERVLHLGFGVALNAVEASYGFWAPKQHKGVADTVRFYVASVSDDYIRLPKM
jgi:hypothetical protein